MRRIETSKTIQLFVLLGAAVFCVCLVIFQSDIQRQIAESPGMKLMSMSLWMILCASFFFLFLDFSMFSKLKSEMKTLDNVAHSDPLAKIANRQGCDEIIEKYSDLEEIPENLGCAVISLSNLSDINRYFTKKEGNKQIRVFSNILKLAATDKCFVGRNGGNAFMVIFENSSSEDIELFMLRVMEKVSEYNKDKEYRPIIFRCGIAFHEDEVHTIDSLISLANKRVQSSVVLPEGYI